MADIRYERATRIYPGTDAPAVDALDLHIELGRLSARAGKGHGSARVGDELACEADLLFVLVDADAT